MEEKISDLVDDADFQAVDRRMGRFNIFEAVGSVRGELKHSNFLGFLLSPSRSHGLGSLLLLRVLRAIIAKMPREQRPIRALELVLADIDGAVVYREWQNFDLLIEIKQIGLVVLIENKIDAQDGDGQLSRYKQAVRDRHPGQRHLFVFLTPKGTDPVDRDYLPFSYSEMAAIIEGLSEARDGSPAQRDTDIVLRHYVEMLRRHIVPDEELQKLARQLYERHKEAFDFIFDSRPAPDSLLGVARSLLEAQPDLTLDRQTSTILGFVPREWIDIPSLNSCDQSTWTKTGRNLMFEIKSWSSGPYEGRVIVSLVSGPASSDIRKKLYERAASRADLFRGLVKPMGKQFATIYMRELLTHPSAKNMNSQERAAAIEAGWTQFLNDELPRLTSAVVDMVRPD